MPSVIVVGSGPAAAGATMALEATSLDVTVIDIGLTLDNQRQSVLQELRAEVRDRWSPENLALITEAPAAGSAVGLPEKRTYGSDYPYRDVGQLDGIRTDQHLNSKLVSGAYGGFSTVWGAQFMPFSESILSEWPVPRSALARSYEKVFDRVPFTAVDDDLGQKYPLYATPIAAPFMSARARQILQRYDRHKPRIRRYGLVMGQARTAVDQRGCVKCGLCHTGCPYGLIYSSAQTFDEMRLRNRVRFESGWIVHAVGEDTTEAFADAQNAHTKERRRFTGDVVLVATGSIKSTQLVASSLKQYEGELTLKESRQFVVPMISLRGVPDPQQEDQNTLGQLFVAEDDSIMGSDASALQLYTYDPSFSAALPSLFRLPIASRITPEIIRRLSVGIGYLPSRLSASMTITLGPPKDRTGLASLVISEQPSDRQPLAIRHFARRLVRAAALLDLWPLIPVLRIAAAGKSYHFGGSLPHHDRPTQWWQTDELGRVPAWRKIHVVDGAVFPSIGPTTFTATVMANAYRIADEVAKSLLSKAPG